MRILIVDDIQGWREYHRKILLESSEDLQIEMASSAREAYDILLENNNSPFDLIITDMQMEKDFEPKYAGEWLIEQIKSLKNYINTKIIIISGAYNIQQIAENLGVQAIGKSTAYNFTQVYKELIFS